MPKLADYIGQVVQIFLIDGTLKDDPENADAAKVRLIDVESFGIWIESFKMNAFILSERKRSSPKTTVFFVPFSQILFVSVDEDYPLLSPKDFGLDGNQE